MGILLGVLAIASLGAGWGSDTGELLDVRSRSYPGYTRVELELSKPVDLGPDSAIRLPGNAAAAEGKGGRLYVDLPSIRVGKRYPRPIEVDDGLLQRVRIGQNRVDRMRIVLDLEAYESHRLRTLHSPHRVVIDVYGPTARRVATQDSAHFSETEHSKRLSMASRQLRTVVIDPGHGGKDPGATGIGGIREKDVNLKLARLLAKRLRARSFRVVMTRTEDRYLDLEERTAVAESARGDLFISLHANASENKALRGIEIYYLDQDHERHNLELAARENGVDLEELDELQQILTKLRLSEASLQSKRVAEHVHQDLSKGLGQTYGTMSDRGVKKGPFRVLFLSSMPAILLESGFLTNRKDSRLLEKGLYLDTLAAQIAAGLGHYRNQGRELGRAEDSLPPVGAR